MSRTATAATFLKGAIKMKKKNKNVKRGNTFVGLAPKVEDRIEIKKRRKEKKHKKKIYEEE